jgi:hypothetical protein
MLCCLVAVEKEEEAVIRMQALADQVARLPGLSHHQMQVGG